MTSSARSLVAPLSHRAVHAARRVAYGLTTGPRELPTYFIVGAKRAGTTSLNEYIVDHPDVVRGLVEKGSRFFDVNYEKGQRWFKRTLIPRRVIDRLEAAAPSKVRPIYGESSPYYAFHPEAPGRIARVVPDARLIFVLRDPIMRAWSHYRYERSRGFESLRFIEALEVETERLSVPDQEQRLFHHRHHSYVGRSMYGPQLARLYEHFDPTRVLVLQSEVLYEQPAPTMARVFGFLGLPPHVAATYKTFKPNVEADIPPEAVEWLEGVFDESNLQLRALLESVPSWA